MQRPQRQVVAGCTLLALSAIALPMNAATIYEDFQSYAIGESNPGQFVSQGVTGTNGISTYAVLANPTDPADLEYVLTAERAAVSGSGNNNAAASIALGSLLHGPDNWTMQVEMRLLGNTGSGNNTFGFSGFSATSNLEGDAYLADIRVSDGNIRMNGFTGVQNATGPDPQIGDLLRLTWQAEYDTPSPGNVLMTLTYDNLTQAGSASVSASIPTANLKAGEFFGFRQRALNSAGVITVAYDNFSLVVATPVPEPSSLLIAAAMTIPLCRGRRC